MHYPEELLFSEEHLWVLVKGDTATIGISEYASEELDGILAVDLPQVGDTIDQGEPIGTLESSKTVSDLYAPISGEVIEVNSDVLEDPAIINECPYDDGWLIKIKIIDEEELSSLMTNIKYDEYIEEESDDLDDYDDEDEEL